MLWLLGAVQRCLRTRSHRQRVGGVWYHVYDQSCVSFVNGWTQNPQDGDAIAEVEDYGVAQADHSAGITSTLPVASTALPAVLSAHR